MLARLETLSKIIANNRTLIVRLVVILGSAFNIFSTWKFLSWLENCFLESLPHAFLKLLLDFASVRTSLFAPSVIPSMPQHWAYHALLIFALSFDDQHTNSKNAIMEPKFKSVHQNPTRKLAQTKPIEEHNQRKLEIADQWESKANLLMT